MKDEDFRDWRNDDAVPREPEERADSGAVEDDPGAAASPRAGAGLQPQAIMCPNCYQNLTGATIGSACPECGLVVGAGVAGSLANRPTSGYAVASLVLGIVSIVGCMLYGIPALICGPLAIIFARQAKKQVLRNEVSASSQSMATAGLVCGLIGTGLAALGWGIFFLFIIMAIATGA
ncbi:MAG: DUF4190 domain-containing protein [Planctomycetota bacterium]